ncbi:MAG: M48 family metalloprotease [Pseudomonadota bacterium]
MRFHRAFVLASMLALSLVAAPVRAVELLRDADLEYGLKQLATPVLRAAGLSPNRVKILVVRNSTLNAFIVSNDAIFLHHGLINKLTSAPQLQAVIAHEAAHIANGHITRRLTNLSAARNVAGLGLALAAVAAASGSAQGAAGLAIGTTSAAQRAFLRHTRAEEASADQSAIRYLAAAGIPPVGMREVLEVFRGQENLSEGRQDPYVRTHPLSRDRVRAVDGFVAAYGAGGAPDATSAYWFARVKGRLSAYTRAPSWTLRQLRRETYPDVKLVREAIAQSRQANTRRALAAIDRALAARPNDPYLHDTRGQILMDARQFAAAANAFGRGAQLAPRDGLILAGYGRALLASGQVGAARDALERARSIDFRDSVMLRDLSVAYARGGQTGMAALVTAERFALQGRLEDAGIHARRASGLLATGSGPWQRAQDVLIASERAAKRRR